MTPSEIIKLVNRAEKQSGDSISGKTKLLIVSKVLAATVAELAERTEACAAICDALASEAWRASQPINGQIQPIPSAAARQAESCARRIRALSDPAAPITATEPEPPEYGREGDGGIC